MIDREGGQLSYCEAEQQQQHQGSVQQRTQYSQQLAFIYIFRYGLSFPFLLKFVGILWTVYLLSMVLSILKRQQRLQE